MQLIEVFCVAGVLGGRGGVVCLRIKTNQRLAGRVPVLFNRYLTLLLSVLNTKTFRYILPFGLHFTPASLFPLQLCDPTELS